LLRGGGQTGQDGGKNSKLLFHRHSIVTAMIILDAELTDYSCHRRH
jgi:hypothetical protein